MASNEVDRSRLHKICDLSYKAQAIWFLNGFWDTHQAEAEKFWAYVNKANEIDLEKHDSGNALDELNAHRLLEMFDETLTVREMRTQLRSVGAIDEKEHPKLVPLAHLLLARYKVDWHHFVNAPQGNSEDIDRAQAQLDACKAAFNESNHRAAEAAAALRQAEAAEAEAKQREADARAREAAAHAAAADLAAKEAELKAAQAELDAAVAEVQKEEEKYNARTAELRQKSETGGVVSMNRAKNELAQHLAEDPLPLRKAKITAEAAAKRNERAVIAAGAARVAAEEAARQAADATAAATAARHAAEAAARESARAKAAADDALRLAEEALQKAEEFLEEVKKTAGGGKGALWWIERELHEQRKYLPTSRGGIAK